MDLESVLRTYSTGVVSADLKPWMIESINARYQFGELLGESNHSGVVLKSLDRTTGEVVAARVFRPRRHGCEPRWVVALQRGLLPTVHLDHSNIVKTREVVELGGNAYLVVMEYLGGSKKLSQLIDDAKPFTLSDILQILISLASAIQHAHSLDMPYMHLSPSRILIDRHGMAKIADWGLTPGRPDVVVPPHCLAPECWSATQDHRADIYSLGMIAFVLATRRWAFTGEDHFDVYKRKMSEPIPHFQLEVPGIPPAFEDFVFKCGARDPGTRYYAMGDVESELRRMLHEFALDGRDSVNIEARPLNSSLH